MIFNAVTQTVRLPNRGVTLIELSIVLVIIGLIVGGISIGSSISYSAKLQSIIADKSQVLSAIASYKDKYKAIPGDDKKAESRFGSSATDDGNDDGTINTPDVNNDSWLFWQHLALAGLWKGTFTGDNGPSATNTAWDAVIDSNVPSSSFKGVGYSIYYSSTTDNNFGSTPQKHFLVVGGAIHTDNKMTFGGWIAPTDIVSIDSKYDDGLAISGDIRTHIATANHDSTSCTTGVAPAHVYGTSSTAKCNLLFMFDPN
jgi:prepilin-type N-terminal cleavage/methylation domain-containing protein